MRFRKGAHAVYNLEYHIVWTPRYRRRLLKGGAKAYLEKVLKNLEGLEEDIEVIAVNAQEDHVHVIVLIPPRVSVASVVKYMKSMTGRKLKEKFEYMRKAIYGRGGIWSRGYCASSVGLNKERIMRYVEYQEQKDKGQLELNLE